MQDNDGTPLAKKAETTSYNDIYSTPDDRPKVSVGKAYAEGAYYVDDPTITEKGTKSFTQQVKDKFNQSKDNLVQQAKDKYNKTVTFDNARKVVKQAVKGAGATFNNEVPQPKLKKNVNNSSRINFGRSDISFGNSSLQVKSSSSSSSKEIDFGRLNVSSFGRTKTPVLKKVKSSAPKEIDFGRLNVSAFGNSKPQVKSSSPKEIDFGRLNVSFNSPKQLKGTKTKLSTMKNTDFGKINVDFGKMNIDFNKKKKGGLF